MSRQEEIREGILTEVKYILKAGDNLTKIAEAECITDQMFNFLRSQGVVIDTGKTEIPTDDKYMLPILEPLIKEE